MDGADSAGSATAPFRQLGEFILRERLATGGQGELYRAEQPALGRDAVVKILRLPERNVEALRARFLREAHIASHLDHPYAAHVYAFGAEGDTLWIAMELVRGTSMADYLETAGPMPLARFVPVFDRLSQVVHSAHEQGIVHRDIKPANVMMVSRAGRLLPKLLDLGIARLTDAPMIERVDELNELSTSAVAMAAALNVTGQGDSHVGTPQYMAPEQWVDPRQADARTDVYALGVLCHEMLTGRRPFEGATLMEVARAHARKVVPPLGEGFPAELTEVLARAMAKRAADRFATPLELAEAVRRAAAVADDELDELPQLPAALRELALTLAPTPIAEAVSMVEGARNPKQLCTALALVARSAVRYVGALALAGRAHLGPGADSDAPEALLLLARLRANNLGSADWLALARGLVRPFAEFPEVHAVPPLVALLCARESGIEALGAIDDLMTAAAAIDDDRERRERAEQVLPRLARALDGLTPLYDYRLAVRYGDRVELRVGARRAGHPTVHAPADAPESGALLLDGEGRATLPLHPFLQALAPSPGAADELFFLDGRGRFGARLVAYPQAFERFDDALWPYLEKAIAPLGTSVRQEAAGEVTPYRGLAPFTAADADAFVGREREIEAFANRLRAQGLIAVVGPSGAGKSSFVQAGVLANLPADWRSVVLRPGVDPMAALSGRVAIPVADSGAAVGREIRRAAESAGGVLVMVIDQFEEVFTLCDDPAARNRFVEALVSATEVEGGAVRCILTLRDDFLLRAQMLEPLKSRLARGLELLTTPGRADLLRIVIEPARRSGFEFDDPALPAEMVGAVENLAGALPLLSFTASRLWELRDRRLLRLTRRAYEGLGGVGGALGKHAEATLEALPPDHQALVREAFRHLVTSSGTRAVMSRRDLGQILGPQASEVLERLIGARLLVGYEGDDGQEQVEIIHEALLASWPRLVTWRGEDAEHARMREQLRSAARQWNERGSPRDLLWRGDVLAEFRAWRARSGGRLTDAEERFASASAALEQRARRVRRAIVVTVLAASLASSVVFAGLRGRARKSELESRERVIALYEEQGRQELLAGRPARAAPYLLAAYAAGGDRGSVRFLLGRSLAGLRYEKAVFRHGAPLRVVAISPAGDLVATGGEDGLVRLWTSRDGAERAVLRGHEGKLRTVAFDASGSTLITGSDNGVAIAWETASGRELRRLEMGSMVRAARWHPRGDWVLIGALKGPAKLWDPSGDRIVSQLEVGEADLTWLDTAPGADLVAGGTRDGTLRLWRPPDPIPVAVIKAHESAIWTGAFSQNGQLLATGGEDRTAALWEVPSGRPLARYPGHAHPVLTVALSGDGTRLVTGSQDGTARIWDAGTARSLQVLSGHASYVRFVALLAGDKRVITASVDGSVRLWDPDSGGLLALVHTHPGLVWTAALSSDRSAIVTAGLDGTSRIIAPDSGALVRQWRPPDGAAVGSAQLAGAGSGGIAVAIGTTGLLVNERGTTELTSHRKPVSSIRFAGDGSAIVTGSEDGTARVLGRDGALVAELQQGEPTYRAVFSPDGQRVATATTTGARVWRRGGGEVCRVAGHKDSVWDVAFGPAGRLLATASDDRTVRLSRADDCGLVRSFPLPARGNTVAFAPGGRALLVGLETGELLILSIDDGRELLRLAGHGDILTAAAISPDGRRIASAAIDGELSIWDRRSGALLLSFAADRGRIADVDFSPDGDQVMSAGASGVRVWQLDLETRSAPDLARLLTCRMPFVLQGELLVASTRQGCQ